jgi:hypothetical protein
MPALPISASRHSPQPYFVAECYREAFHLTPPPATDIINERHWQLKIRLLSLHLLILRFRDGPTEALIAASLYFRQTYITTMGKLYRRFDWAIY